VIVNEYLSWRRRWARITPYADVEPDAVRDHADQHADRAGLMAEIARLPRMTSGTMLRHTDGFLDMTLGFSDAGSSVEPTFGPFPAVTVEFQNTASCLSPIRTVVVRGYRGCLQSMNGVDSRDRSLNLQAPGGWVTIGIDHNDLTGDGAYSDAELRKIAESMTLAPIDQPATWYDADTAIPH